MFGAQFLKAVFLICVSVHLVICFVELSLHIYSVVRHVIVHTLQTFYDLGLRTLHIFPVALWRPKLNFFLFCFLLIDMLFDLVALVSVHLHLSFVSVVLSGSSLCNFFTFFVVLSDFVHRLNCIITQFHHFCLQFVVFGDVVFHSDILDVSHLLYVVHVIALQPLVHFIDLFEQFDEILLMFVSLAQQPILFIFTGVVTGLRLYDTMLTPAPNTTTGHKCGVPISLVIIVGHRGEWIIPSYCFRFHFEQITPSLLGILWVYGHQGFRIINVWWHFNGRPDWIVDSMLRVLGLTINLSGFNCCFLITLKHLIHATNGCTRILGHCIQLVHVLIEVVLLLLSVLNLGLGLGLFLIKIKKVLRKTRRLFPLCRLLAFAISIVRIRILVRGLS